MKMPCIDRTNRGLAKNFNEGIDTKLYILAVYFILQICFADTEVSIIMIIVNLILLLPLKEEIIQ